MGANSIRTSVIENRGYVLQIVYYLSSCYNVVILYKSLIGLSFSDDYSEHRRLFQPLTDAQHFVVTGYRIEE